MGVKEIITGNTALVEQATSLLSDLSDRDGGYIWEKYSYTLPASDIYALSGSDGRIIYYADAYTLSGSTYALVNPKSISLWASDTSPVSKLAGKYFLVATESASMMYRGMDTITTVLSGTDLYLRNVHVISNITESMLTEIGYAVGDEEDSYPDGGELDGYWYKVMDSGSAIKDFFEAMGYSKVNVSTFTFSTRTVMTTKLTNTLGELPDLLIIIPKNPSEVADDLAGIYLQRESSTVSDFWIKGVINIRAKGYQGGIMNVLKNQSYVYINTSTFYFDNSVEYYGKGVEYTLILAKR